MAVLKVTGTHSSSGDYSVALSNIIDTRYTRIISVTMWPPDLRQLLAQLSWATEWSGAYDSQTGSGNFSPIRCTVRGSVTLRSSDFSSTATMWPDRAELFGADGSSKFSLLDYRVTLNSIENIFMSAGILYTGISLATGEVGKIYDMVIPNLSTGVGAVIVHERYKQASLTSS